MINISKILNLEKGEGRIVIFPVVFSFLMGASMAYFVTGATSLFLSSFDREYLSLSFVVAGILVIVVGWLIKFLQNKLDFSKNIPSTLLFLLLSVFILVFLYLFFEITIIIFLLYAWIRIFAYIQAVTFWSFAGRVFSLRQAKRIFGLISGGEVIASIISFFSVPILLNFLQTVDFLIIALIFLFLAFIYLLFMVRKFKDKMVVKKQNLKINQNLGIKYSQSKFFILFFFIAFVPVFAQFFVDFIFQAQAKVEFPDREELTAFVGLFFGLSAIVEFVLKYFVSGRLLNIYGVKFGLLAFPVVLAISFFLSSFLGVIYGAAGIFFSFVTLGRLFTRAVRTSFNDTSTQILYQPLPSEQRAVFQNKIESGPKAYASIVAGVLLFLFAKIPNFSIIYFSLFLFLITLVWIWISIQMYKEYKVKLQSVLTDTKENNIQPNQINDKKLFTSKIEKYICGIQNPYDFISKKETKFSSNYKINQLADFVKSQLVEKRILAAQELKKFNIYRTEKLYEQLLNDENYEVRSTAILNCGLSKEKELFQSLIANLKIEKYRNVVTQAILQVGESIDKDLIKLFSVADYDTKLQITIIFLLEKNKSQNSLDFLRKTIFHHNALISDRTLSALVSKNYIANRTEALKISEILDEKISDFIYIVVSILDLKSEEFYELTVLLNKQKENKIESIFNIMSILYDKNAIDLIRNNFESENEDSRAFAVEVADTVFSETHKGLLMPILENIHGFELIKKYKYEFPQEKLNPLDRIIDIINCKMSIVGEIVKIEAIKFLTYNKDEKSTNILKANVLHPDYFLREVVAFALYSNNKNVFTEELVINQRKNKKVNEIVDKINIENKVGNLLNFEKIDLIKNEFPINLLENYQLLNLANNSKEIVFSEGQNFTLNEKTKNIFYVLLMGEICIDNFIFTNGDIIGNFLFEQTEINIKIEERALMLVADIYIFNSLLINNSQFANKLVEKYS